MGISKLFEQLKNHPFQAEVIDKLNVIFDKYKTVLYEKGFESLGDELCNEMYEAINGPHFDEVHAYQATAGMINEDGSHGPHWTVEETTSVANQMGIDFKSGKCNKWDWYVAMNMVYSDFYKAIYNITGNTNAKYFAELTKAWLNDKDIADGKMWHYYTEIMRMDKEDDEVKEIHHNHIPSKASVKYF